MSEKTDMQNTENSPQDEDFFERYLQKNSSLSAQYQQIDTPQPSEKVNQAILDAARQQANRNHWWSRPGSWAATAAIVSITGLLTHTLWQSDQTPLQQEIQQGMSQEMEQAAPLADAISEPVAGRVAEEAFSGTLSDSRSNTLQKNAMPQKAVPSGTGVFEAMPSTIAPSKKSNKEVISTEKLSKKAMPAKSILHQDQAKDTRQLRYQSAPSPMMPSAADSLRHVPLPIELKKEDIHNIPSAFEADESTEASVEMSNLQELSPAQVSGKPSQAYQWQEQIRQFLTQGQNEKARDLLLQLREKYPEYPVDPEILKQLSSF